MAGLQLRGSGGIGMVPSPTMGSQGSYDSVTSAAFGPGVTTSPSTAGQALHPATPVGAAFWTGVAALGLLVLIRHSLPN